MGRGRNLHGGMGRFLTFDVSLVIDWLDTSTVVQINSCLPGETVMTYWLAL